jgi:hypothetical protein
VHLWGSPRQRGYAYGKIAGDLIAPCFAAFFERIQQEVEEAIEKVPKPLRDVVIKYRFLDLRLTSQTWDQCSVGSHV